MSGTPAQAVVCLGDLMVDVVARLPGPLVTGSDTPAPIAMMGGGSAANTACWLGILGVPVSLIARIGTDALGDRALEDLARCRVTLDGVTRDPERPTGTCIVLVDPNGERTMIPDAGANLALAVDNVRSADFGPGRHLHVSAYTLFGAARPAALHAVASARAAGMTISVDAASVAPLSRLGPTAFLELIGVDVLVFANADEARLLAGARDLSVCARTLAATVGRAVVKCGSGGAIYADGSTLWSRPAPWGGRIIDTTGAGDAFAAGFIAAQARGLDPTAALDAAQVLARDACTSVGGRPTVAVSGKSTPETPRTPSTADGTPDATRTAPTADC